MLDIVAEADLDLTLPPGTVTWEARRSSSTIDLISMSTSLVPMVEHCKSRPGMGQSSDHIPLSTRLSLLCEQNTPSRRRAWKTMDMDKLKMLLKDAPHSRVPRTTAEIASAVEEIQGYLIDQTVPWAKPSEWAKPFWDPECNAVTRVTRRLRETWSGDRTLENWRVYVKSNNRKQKVIDKTKRLHYRKVIAETTGTPAGLWRLAKWAKNKSDSPKEVPKTPQLRFQREGLPDEMANTFDDKIAMLKNSFFPPPPAADPSDIENHVYPMPADCPAVVTEEEVLRALNRPKADKAPGPDGITNRLLQECETADG